MVLRSSRKAEIEAGWGGADSTFVTFRVAGTLVVERGRFVVFFLLFSSLSPWILSHLKSSFRPGHLVIRSEIAGRAGKDRR